MGTQILTVEDDERIRTAVRLALEDEGWDVVEARSGEEALDLFKRSDADVVLIDIMLPGIDGFEVCRSIRRSSDVPVVMVTARDDTHDVVAGLEAGADDYLTKPFAIRELQARVRALIRRGADHPDPIVAIGSLRVDTAARTVARDGRSIALTGMEYALLELLALRRGQLVPRSAIYEHLWNDDSETMSNVVDVYVANLRQKLGREVIETRRGQGYVLP